MDKQNISQQMVICYRGGLAELLDYETKKVVRRVSQNTTFLSMAIKDQVLLGCSEHFLRRWSINEPHPVGIPFRDPVEGLATMREQAILNTPQGLYSLDLRSLGICREADSQGGRVFG